MLKEYLIAAVVLAFRPRPAVTMPVIETPPPPPVPVVSVEDACREYLAELVEFYGNNEVRFVWISHGYRQLRTAPGEGKPAPRPHWPPLSDKVLSQTLCELGCDRFKRDLRSRGEGRPTFLVMPDNVRRAA